jgi:alanine-glyoxylate transaminase/serine-glyoxylate transaminase/serine-pyruvate transaminase
MEMCLANLIEPGDVVLVGVSGYFSERIYDMAKRYGADVRRIEATWGTWFTLETLRSALETHKPSLLCLVNGETSTGVFQGIKGVGDLCREFNALLMVDTVASLGGVPFYVDAWGVDACYTGGQKCLSGPPGISPLTFSARSMQKIKSRKTPVANWYLDATMLEQYWCPTEPALRKYHHTTPANLLYSLREALILVYEEGIEAVWDRHAAAAKALYSTLNALGLKCYVQEGGSDGGKLPSLTSVCVPDGVDAKAVQKFLLDAYGIEVAGGLGQLAGKVWRVGLMGHNARIPNVKLLEVALKEALHAAKL